jgi:hypothetical protein
MSPLMNMIGYVGGRGLSERGQNLCTSLILYRQLKMCQEIHDKRIKVDKGVMLLALDQVLGDPWSSLTYFGTLTACRRWSTG